jgi:transcriptional regulator with XRE-family HTH domain
MKCQHCNGTGEEPDNAKIGANLRLLRKRHLYSGRTVARLMGISAAYLSDLELGRRRWSSKLIESYQTTVTHPRE